jgi:hypothetical protein
MYKIYIVSALTFTSIFIASAQARQVGSMPVTSTGASNQPTEVKRRPMMISNQEVGVNVSNRAGETMPARMPLPATGDIVLDAKIATLIQERDAKIKAIDEEYKTKIQALIGTRPLKAYPMMATGTMMRKGIPSPVQGGTPVNNGRVLGSSVQGDVTGGVEMASGTEQVVRVRPPVVIDQTPTQSPRAPMIIGQQAEASTIVGQGIGAQFNSLFRGIFGRNK